MKKKILATIVCMAMVVGTLTGCGGGSSETAPAETSEAADEQTEASDSEAAGGSETVSLTVWGAEEDQTLLAELVEDFKAAYSALCSLWDTTGNYVRRRSSQHGSSWKRQIKLPLPVMLYA